MPNDTDFYTQANVKEYLEIGSEETEDDSTLDQFGAVATKDTQNFLVSIFGAGNVPTGSNVTDDMKARTDFKVCALFKGKIKEYKAKDHFKDMMKVSEDSIKLEAKATPRSTSTAKSYAQTYRTEPLASRTGL